MAPGKVDLVRAGIIRHAGMKISAPSKGADLPGSITRATRGSGSQNLSTTCKGSSSSTGSHLSSSNLATLAPGSAAKTQQSRAEGKSHRQLLLATRRSTIPAIGKEMLQDHSPQSLWRVAGIVKIHIRVVGNSI